MEIRAMIRVVAALLLVAAGVSGAPQRVESLERVLLAPCCYKEPISRHHSEAAVKMKLELAAMVAQGKSDGEILETFRQRYGARVVAPPEPEPSPWVRLIPWLAVVAGAVLIFRVLARWRGRRTSAPELPAT